MGCGKTLTAVYLAKIAKNIHKKIVWANFRLQNADLIKSAEELLIYLMQKNDDRPLFLVIDELRAVLPAMSWQTTKNNFYDVIFGQSRKKECDIIYTSQNPFMVDRNVRRITDIVLAPYFNKRRNVVYVTALEYSQLSWIPSTFRFKATPYFVLYDTREVIKRDDNFVTNFFYKQFIEKEDSIDLLSQCKTRRERINLIKNMLGVGNDIAQLIYLRLPKE